MKLLHIYLYQQFQLTRFLGLVLFRINYKITNAYSFDRTPQMGLISCKATLNT